MRPTLSSLSLPHKRPAQPSGPDLPRVRAMRVPPSRGHASIPSSNRYWADSPYSSIYDHNGQTTQIRIRTGERGAGGACCRPKDTTRRPQRPCGITLLLNTIRIPSQRAAPPPGHGLALCKLVDASRPRNTTTTTITIDMAVADGCH